MNHTVSLLQIFQWLLMSLQVKEQTNDPLCGPRDPTGLGDPSACTPFPALFCSLFVWSQMPLRDARRPLNSGPLCVTFLPPVWKGFLCSSRPVLSARDFESCTSLCTCRDQSRAGLLVPQHGGTLQWLQAGSSSADSRWSRPLPSAPSASPFLSVAQTLLLH